MNTSQNYILILAAGEGSTNPGHGGWSSVIERTIGGETLSRKVLTGGDDSTTYLRMEMTAVITALRQLAETEALPIIVHTGSKLVANGVNFDLADWVANGWKKINKKPVENQDLWRQLEDLIAGRGIRFLWVRDTPSTEEVARLASQEAHRRRSLLVG